MKEKKGGCMNFKVKAFLKVLSVLIFSFFVFNILPHTVLGIDEYINETKIERGFEALSKNITVELKQESVYNFNSENWTSFEYASCFGIPIKEYLTYELEYKYIEERDAEDAEEIENNIILGYNPYFCKTIGLEIEDENKFTVNIREGEWGYSNEIKLCQWLYKINNYDLYFLLEDELGLNLQTNEWSKNKLKSGFAIQLSEYYKLELKYIYTENIVDKTYSDGIKTEITFKF